MLKMYKQFAIKMIVFVQMSEFINDRLSMKIRLDFNCINFSLASKSTK